MSVDTVHTDESVLRTKHIRRYYPMTRGKHIHLLKGAKRVLRDVYEFLDYVIRVINGIIVEIRYYPI